MGLATWDELGRDRFAFILRESGGKTVVSRLLVLDTTAAIAHSGAQIGVIEDTFGKGRGSNHHNCECQPMNVTLAAALSRAHRPRASSPRRYRPISSDHHQSAASLSTTGSMGLTEVFDNGEKRGSRLQMDRIEIRTHLLGGLRSARRIVRGGEQESAENRLPG